MPLQIGGYSPSGRLLFICTFMSVIGLFFLEPFINVLAVPVRIQLASEKAIWMILFLGGPFIGMQMAMGGLLRARGRYQRINGRHDVRFYFKYGIGSRFFILLLNMGVAGAALATTIGNIGRFSILH